MRGGVGKGKGYVRTGNVNCTHNSNMYPRAYFMSTSESRHFRLRRKAVSEQQPTRTNKTRYKRTPPAIIRKPPQLHTNTIATRTQAHKSIPLRHFRLRRKAVSEQQPTRTNKTRYKRTPPAIIRKPPKLHTNTITTRTQAHTSIPLLPPSKLPTKGLPT